MVNLSSNELLSAFMASNCQIVINTEDLTNIVAYVMQEERKRVEEEHARHEEHATMSVDEVANIFQVDRSTLARWEKEGVLSCTRIGGRVFYKRSYVDEILKNGSKSLSGKRRGRPRKNRAENNDTSSLNA